MPVFHKLLHIPCLLNVHLLIIFMWLLNTMKLCMFCSCGYAGDVVSIQPRSSDDNSLLPLHVHGVNAQKNPPCAPVRFCKFLCISIQTVLVSCVLSCSLFGGYFAGRLYRTLKGHRWKKGAFCVSTNSWNICCIKIIELGDYTGWKNKK